MSGLGVRESLLAAAAERRQADRSEARLLELAVHTVGLYLVGEDTAVAAWRDPLLRVPVEGDPIADRLAGAGTPVVAEHAVEELAAALDVSYLSGCGLVADALEPRYRLPRLWALVQEGRLQAWKARRVAALTTHLGARAVGFVDAQAAIAGGRNRITGNLAGLVHQALVRFEPETARRREDAAQRRREVRFDYHPDQVNGDGVGDGVAGSATVYARLDAVDAHDLDAAVSRTADQLGRLGDDSPLDERRARALGALAHPQQVLALFEKSPHSHPHPDPDAGPDVPATGGTSSTVTATI